MNSDNFELKHPTTIQVELTENCNHRCFYCYNFFRDKNTSKNNMTKENAEKLADKIVNEVRPFNVVLTGGEPMTNYDVTKYFMKRLEEGRIRSNLNSNLTAISEKRMDEMKNIKGGYLQILTSIPSNERKTYKKITGRDNLPQFLNNLETALSKGIQVIPNMVFHKLNKDQVYDTGKYLYENYGIKNFTATLMVSPPGNKNPYGKLSNGEMVKPLEDLLRLREDYDLSVDSLEVLPLCSLPEHLREESIFNRRCSAGVNTLAIGHNGDVRACPHSPITEGNLLDDKYEDIWDNLKPYRQNQHIPKKCLEECVVSDNCMGGCRFEGYEEDKDGLDKEDTRMTEPFYEFKTKRKPIEIDPDKKYEVSNFTFRKENDKNQYTIFNGSPIYANEGLKNFLLSVKDQGYFRLNDFPESMREKAKGIGKHLLAKGYLKEEENDS